MRRTRSRGRSRSSRSTTRARPCSRHGSKKGKQPEFGGAKSDAAHSIISILEMCGEDFTKLHSEVEAGEAEAVDAYEKLMQENKVSKAAKQTEVKGSLSEIKSLTTSLANNQED